MISNCWQNELYRKRKSLHFYGDNAAMILSCNRLEDSSDSTKWIRSVDISGPIQWQMQAEIGMIWRLLPRMRQTP